MSAAEWIAKRRELLDAATEGPWLYGGDDWEGATVEMPDDGSGGVAYIATGMRQGPNEGEDDAALIADARTSLPRALDALEAVLAPHQMHEVPGGQRWCLHCGGDWPCPTVDAAETALRGES